MSNIVVSRSYHFTIVNNELLKDATLSMQAKGLYAYVMSNAENFKIYKRELEKHFSNGRDSIDRAWKELVDAGWLKSEKVTNENSQFIGWNHTFYDSRQTENPMSGNPTLGKPDTNNNQHKKINNNKTTTTVGKADFGDIDIEAVKSRLMMVGLPLDDAQLKREWAYYQIAIESSQSECEETIEKWTKRFIHALCKQREKKKVFNRVNPFLPDESGKLVPYDEIVKMYHEILPNNPKCQGLDSSRQGDIASLVESGEIPTTKQWRNYLKYCAKSPFILNGINGWVADFSWLIRMKNYLTIKEGLRDG